MRNNCNVFAQILLRHFEALNRKYWANESGIDFGLKKAFFKLRLHNFSEKLIKVIQKKLWKLCTIRRRNFYQALLAKYFWFSLKLMKFKFEQGLIQSQSQSLKWISRRSRFLRHQRRKNLLFPDTKEDSTNRPCTPLLSLCDAKFYS